jgi:SPP1 gp7 family putative phage head morphogenesis protein
MSDFAHDYTDKEIEALEKRITKAYKTVYKELSKKATDYFEQFEKRDTEQLALLNEGQITELEYQQWRLAQMGRGKRFEAMRDDAAERLTKANQIAASYIKDEMPDIFAVNLNHMAYGLEKEYGNIGFTIYNEEMAKKLIADEADFLPAPSINVPKDLWWNKKLITAEMTSGILQGESTKKLADRFQNVTDANRVSAIRNARTFCTAAENAGRQEGFNQAAKMGVKVRKQWLATLDNRTRHSHQLLDGQIVDYDKPFKSVLGSKMMYPADKSGAKAGDLYNCRCTMITVEKSGIVAEPIEAKVFNPVTGKEELIPKMSYKEWEQWKKAQSDD